MAATFNCAVHISFAIIEVMARCGDATSKKQSAKNENLQKVNNELKKKIREINMSRENEQALNATAMKSLEEKLVAKMTVEKEDHTANVKIMEGKYRELMIKVEELEKDLQRKCEEIEVATDYRGEGEHGYDQSQGS